MTATRYTSIETPLGTGYYAYTERGVVMISVGDEDRFLDDAHRRFGEEPMRSDPPAAFAERVRECLERGDGSIVDWDSLPAFQRRVLEACAAIPRGSVASYGELAEAIGAPRAARAVGTALARNPIPLLIPCHRVVRAGGMIGNYGLGGAAVKTRLLQAENV